MPNLQPSPKDQAAAPMGVSYPVNMRPALAGLPEKCVPGSRSNHHVLSYICSMDHSQTRRKPPSYFGALVLGLVMGALVVVLSVWLNGWRWSLLIPFLVVVLISFGSVWWVRRRSSR